MRWLRDWLASLDDAELRRCRFVRRAPVSNELPESEREGRRINESEAARLRRIERLGR